MDVCASRSVCAAYAAQHQKEPMLSHLVPDLPWQKISQDIFYLQGKSYLVTVDHYSDFVEVDQVKDSSSESVILASKQQFARHGILQFVITDNGPAFALYEYAAFSKTYEFEHTANSPYYSQGNGRAEAAVKSAKLLFEKAEDPWLTLLDHRNTLPEGMQSSSAQRLMSRQTRTQLPNFSGLVAT